MSKHLVIKINDGQAGHFCAVCHDAYRAAEGPEVFVDGDPAGVVCPNCARRRAPELAKVLAAWQAFEEFRFKWHPTPEEQAFREQWLADHADLWDASR